MPRPAASRPPRLPASRVRARRAPPRPHPLAPQSPSATTHGRELQKVTAERAGTNAPSVDNRELSTDGAIPARGRRGEGAPWRGAASSSPRRTRRRLHRRARIVGRSRRLAAAQDGPRATIPRGAEGPSGGCCAARPAAGRASSGRRRAGASGSRAAFRPRDAVEPVLHARHGRGVVGTSGAGGAASRLLRTIAASRRRRSRAATAPAPHRRSGASAPARSFARGDPSAPRGSADHPRDHMGVSGIGDR